LKKREFKFEVQPVFKIIAINQERTQCGTASGSERMLRSTVSRAFRADSTLSACIRSLPLAVLHWLHFDFEFAVFQTAWRKESKSAAASWQ
jgi:hypothetical protein